MQIVALNQNSWKPSAWVAQHSRIRCVRIYFDGFDAHCVRSSRPNLSDGAGGGTRTLTGLPPTDFRTSYGFRRRHKGVCGLDYTFTLAFAQASALGAARLVSTPSLSGLARGC